LSLKTKVHSFVSGLTSKSLGRFISGLTLKPLGWFVSVLTLKPLGRFISVWPQNRWRQFSWFGLKIKGNGFPVWTSKLAAAI
jgi:hypothetical protein